MYDLSDRSMQTPISRQSSYSLINTQTGMMVSTPTPTMVGSGSGHATPIPQAGHSTHSQLSAQNSHVLQNISKDSASVLSKVDTIEQITQGYSNGTGMSSVQRSLLSSSVNAPMYRCHWSRCGAMFSKAQELNDHIFYHEQERQRQQRQQQQYKQSQSQRFSQGTGSQSQNSSQPSAQRQSSTSQQISAATYTTSSSIVPEVSNYAHSSVNHDFYRSGGYSDSMYVAPSMSSHSQTTSASQAQAHVWHPQQVQVQQARPLSTLPPPLSSTHNTGTFPCLWEKCGQVFMTQASLQSHTIVHTSGQSGSSTLVRSHSKSEAGNGKLNGNDPFTCTWEQGCQKQFATLEQYNQHMYEHSRYAETTATNITKCTHPGCRKTFIRKAEMELHRETHNKDFPHECPIPGCEKKFNHKGSLNIHIRTHTQDKRYVCTWEGCEKRFLHRGNLNSHLRTHSGEKPHQCTWEGCTKRFQHKGNLNTHLRRHAGNKPYVCPEAGCDKRFTTHATMDYHIRTHTGDHPFACTWRNCNKRFITKGNLNVHMRTHTGDKPYRCTWDKCKKCFSTQASLDYHIKTHNKRAEGLAASVSTNDAAALILGASVVSGGGAANYLTNMGQNSSNKNPAPSHNFF